MYSNELVLNLLNFIDDNLYIQLSIQELSRIFHFHKDYIMRVFKKEIGCTIIEYINKKRIYQSLFSFSNQDNSILKISILYGFSSLEYFSEIFKKYIGVSPKIYRSYLLFGHNISLENVIQIQNHISSLDAFFSFVDHYKKNSPPKNNHMVLSIFK